MQILEQFGRRKRGAIYANMQRQKELLSMVTITKHIKHYLLGKMFILRTDHNSLR